MRQESKQRPAFRKTAILLALAAIGGGSLEVLAQEQSDQGTDAAQATLADLEKAYWFCDYASTVTRLDMGTAMSCSVVNETLKRRKFGGNFEAMLVWWQDNKAAQHRAFEEQLHASADR